MVPLHGSGTTNPRNWFGKVMMEIEHQARVPLLLTYRAVGSSTGQKEFVGDDASTWMSYSHFGAGDIPMTKERYDTLDSHGLRGSNNITGYAPMLSAGVREGFPSDPQGAPSRDKAAD